MSASRKQPAGPGIMASPVADLEARAAGLAQRIAAPKARLRQALLNGSSTVVIRADLENLENQATAITMALTEARVERQRQEAAEARAARSNAAAADAAREATTAPPAAVRPEDIAGAGGTLAVIEKLQACIRAAEQVMAYARTEDGRVRNVKALLAASQHLRRSLETAIKVQQTMMELAEVEKFHQAIFDVLREETPELVERVVRRLHQLRLSGLRCDRGCCPAR